MATRTSHLQHIFLLGKLFVLSIVLCMPFSQSQAARSPSANRECAICHIMWLNAFKRIDVATLVPYDPQPTVKTGKQDVVSTEDMCFSCHDGFVMDSRFMWKTGKYSHPVGQKPTRNIKIPMVDGKQVFPLNVDGNVYCGTCHSAHGVDWNQGESPLFLRMKNVNSSICITCHEEKTSGPKHGNHPIKKIPHTKPDNLIAVGSKFTKTGQVICQSCHKPHGAADKKILVVKNNESNLCRSCHSDKKSINQTKHNLALSRPDAVNVKGNKASETGPCSVCHIPHGAKGAALWARRKHNSDDPAAAPCLGCHNEEGLAKKKAIVHFNHPTQAAVSKLGIKVKKGQWQTKHTDLLGDKSLQSLPLYNRTGQRVKHGGNISCGSCHDPHVWSVSEQKPRTDDEIAKEEGDSKTSFLRIANDKDNQLCANCHVDKRSVMLSKHNLDISLAGKKANQREREGVCTACHAAHNGKGPYMHANSSGPGDGAIEKICRHCHQEDGMAKDKTIGQHSHPIAVGLDAIGAKTKLPLFDINGRRDEDGNVDCATCHNVHQWQPGKRNTKKGAKADIEGTGLDSFLRIKMDSKSSLCVSCHKKQKPVLYTDHDMNITVRHAQNVHGQTMKRSGVCGACHVPHNANSTVGLWARPLGEGNDLKEQMCKSCHRMDGVAKAKVPPETQHPSQVFAWAGEIRRYIMGKLIPKMPVYTSTGKADLVAKITCTTCHNPHRWSEISKKGSGRNIEGNVLNSFLRNSKSGKMLCADCHGRDGLFRYKYYHAKSSRKPYSFSE